MTERNTAMETLVAELQATTAGRRVVTRSYRDFADRTDHELRQGVFTVLSKGVRDLTNSPGRMAEFGKHLVTIVGQIVLTESADGAAIESAEFALFADIKALAERQLPEPIGGLQVLSFSQSQQLDAPYGWIAVEIVLEP